MKFKHILCAVYMHAQLLHFCLTLCDLMDCSLPGSSVHGILYGRILEWVAVHFSRRSSELRDQTCISCIAGGFFTTEPPGKPSNILPSHNWSNKVTKLVFFGWLITFIPVFQNPIFYFSSFQMNKNRVFCVPLLMGRCNFMGN